MAHTKPDSSRTMAATTTVGFLPVAQIRLRDRFRKLGHASFRAARSALLAQTTNNG